MIRLTPDELAEIKKQSALAKAEAHGHGDYSFQDWCTRNAKQMHRNCDALLAHIEYAPEQATVDTIAAVIDSELWADGEGNVCGTHDAAQVLLSRFPGMGK